MTSWLCCATFEHEQIEAVLKPCVPPTPSVYLAYNRSLRHSGENAHGNVCRAYEVYRPGYPQC